jgi:nucleoside-diphosphate-sugar epimerase
MRVLVTGAAGQVGSRLVRQLLINNYEVKALILPEDPNRSRLDELDVEIVEGNLLDTTVCEQAIGNVNAVIHTANLVGPLPGMSETEFFNNNVISTFNLVSAASKQVDRLQRLVHISSSSVYPNDAHTIATEYNPVDEMHPLRPEGPYPISKLVGEEIIGGYTRQTGLRTTILRPSGICSGTAVLRRWSVAFVCNILRAGQRSPRGSLYMPDGTELWHDLEAAADSEDQPCAIRSTSGEPWVYQLVDARDVAHGCVCALENDSAPGDAFNISAPEPITFDEAAEVISQMTGLPILKWQVPVRWLFDLSNVKARNKINYQPKWGIREMVESALAVQRGESDGLT